MIAHVAIRIGSPHGLGNGGILYCGGSLERWLNLLLLAAAAAALVVVVVDDDAEGPMAHMVYTAAEGWIDRS